MKIWVSDEKHGVSNDMLGVSNKNLRVSNGTVMETFYEGDLC